MEQSSRIVIIGSLIGAAAVIVGAIITYIATVKAPKIPIEATQTAVAMETANAVRLATIHLVDQPTASNSSSTIVPAADIVFIDHTPPESLDEYVEIKSNSDAAIDMRNWSLSDEGGANYEIDFDFVLDPGATVKIWTKEGTNTHTDLFWGRKSCVWNDDSPDTAYLKDRSGTLIDDYSYQP